jgi:hypothetical protein
MKQFTLRAYLMRAGQGSFRFKGEGEPPLIKDLYIERHAIGPKCPQRVTVTVTWEEDGQPQEN